MKDHYRTLEVAPFARSSVIDAAYKALMKEVHPDVSGSISGERAKMLTEAHDELLNKRSDYDRKRRDTKPKTIGNYKILTPIAEGGFGRTYKAEHVVLKELVCIKDCFNISEEENAFLIQEARAVWDLRHYALPAMRDLIQLEDGRVVLVMSYIPGPTLEQLVKKVGAIDPEHVCWIAERVINAMNYMHRCGVVHGDIKPQNIIVQEDRHMAVLVDFGLSAVKPTSKDEAKGYTQFFGAPEQIAGKPLLPETDYYSLGMTMLYALSGGTEYVQRKLIPAHVPDDVCAFVKKLIARDMSSRPQYPRDDLGDMIVQIRQNAFGRRRSSLRPICGK